MNIWVSEVCLCATILRIAEYLLTPGLNPLICFSQSSQEVGKLCNTRADQNMYQMFTLLVIYYGERYTTTTSAPQNIPLCFQHSYFMAVGPFWRSPFSWASLKLLIKRTLREASKCRVQKGRPENMSICRHPPCHWVWHCMTSVWLLPKIKITLRSKHFESAQDIKTATTAQLKTHRDEGFQNHFRKQQEQ